MSDNPCKLNNNINNEIGPSFNEQISLANDIGAQFLQPELSDLVLIVQGRRFSVHRVLLAARSQYFRALLYSGLKETFLTEIEMDSASEEAFEHILRFIYKGHINIGEMSGELIMDLLSLSHRYGLVSIEKHISAHLAHTLTTQNTINILNTAILYSITQLIDRCLIFIDKHPPEFLGSDLFITLSQGALIRIIERDSFCAPEVDIYDSVARWLKNNVITSTTTVNSDSEKFVVDTVISHVRLSLIPIQDLLDRVRPAGLVQSDLILDAIESQYKGCQLPHRGLMIADENLVTDEAGAVLLHGSAENNRLTALDHSDGCDAIYAEHVIDEQSRIVVRLGRPSKVNIVRLHLLDNDNRSYSYFVEVSVDQQLWTVVADYRKYFCRSRQTLYFESIVVRYIRVTGTKNTAGRMFSVMSIECLYTDKSFKILDGLQVPDYNVASVDRYANVIDGVSRNRNSLLQGPTKNYNWDSGYTCHQLGSGAIIVQLAQPYLLNCVSFLLWDLDDRSYGYTVEVSPDKGKWTMICDRSGLLCSSLQLVKFDCQPVVFIRIIGTHNTANEVFHIVYLEAYYCYDNIESSSLDDTVQKSLLC